MSREAGAGGFGSVCLMCENGETETVEHLMLKCPAYAVHRTRLMDKMGEAYEVGTGRDIKRASAEELMRVALGGRVGSSAAEDNIDHAVKRYLKRTWRTREWLTKITNEILDRNDVLEMRQGTSDIFGL